jgi:hypothetical protein
MYGYWGVMVSHSRAVSVHGEGPHCKLPHTPREGHDSWVWAVGLGV